MTDLEKKYVLQEIKDLDYRSKYAEYTDTDDVWLTLSRIADALGGEGTYAEIEVQNTAIIEQEDFL